MAEFADANEEGTVAREYVNAHGPSQVLPDQRARTQCESRSVLKSSFLVQDHDRQQDSLTSTNESIGAAYGLCVAEPLLKGRHRQRGPRAEGHGTSSTCVEVGLEGEVAVCHGRTNSVDVGRVVSVGR